MPFVKVKVPRTSQPQDIVPIDWTNPITRGLVLVLSGDSPYDYVTQKLLTVVSGAKNKAISASGVGLSTVGSNVGIRYAVSNAQALVNASEATVLSAGDVIADTGNADTSFHYLVTFTPDAPDYFYLGIPSYSSQKGLAASFYQANYGGSTNPSVSGFFERGLKYAVLTTYKQNGASTLWAGGKQLASVAAGAQPLNGGALSPGLALATSGALGANNTTLTMVWRRELAVDERKSITEQPHQVWEPEEVPVFVGAGPSGAVMLEALAAAQASSAAAMLKGVSLAGSSLSVASAGADLGLGKQLGATGAGQASASVAMAHSVPLAAVAAGSVSASGQVSLTVTFAAAAVGQALATAQAALGKSLAAAGSGQAAGSADLSVAAGGSAVNLAASAAGQASSQVTLSLAISMSAAALAQAASSAAFGGAAALATQAIANAQASASMAVGKPLGASGSGQAGAGVVIWLQVPLGAAALAQAGAGGALKLQVDLSAAALGQAGSAANLPVAVSLSANGVAVAGASATLQLGSINLIATPGYSAHCTGRRWSALAPARKYLVRSTPRNYVARATLKGLS